MKVRLMQLDSYGLQNLSEVKIENRKHWYKEWSFIEKVYKNLYQLQFQKMYPSYESVNRRV